MHMAPRVVAWVAWVAWTCNNLPKAGVGAGLGSAPAVTVKKERASARSFFAREMGRPGRHVAGNDEAGT